MPTLSHFAMRRRMRLSAIRCLRKRMIHAWAMASKKPRISVKHPVHLLPENADMKSVQRIVLAASRSESVGEPEEVLLVDGFENRHDRLLDDFVLQAQNAQRPFRAISLRNVGSSGRTRSVTAPVHL